MGSRRKLAILALATLLAGAAAFPNPEQPISIGGRVVDSEGSSLPVVPLMIGRSGRPGFEPIVKTDMNGRYEIHGLEPGIDYLIRVDYPGFAPVELGPLAVDAESEFHLDITLRSTADTTWVWIGGRTLDKAEQQFYLEAKACITEAVRHARFPTIDLVLGLLGEVNALPEVVSEDSRDALRDWIVEILSGIVEPGDPILFSLLRDPDPEIQLMAISILYNQDTDSWFQDSELRALLQGMLGSTDVDPLLTQGILGSFLFADRFEEVRQRAVVLARGEDSELARDAAQVISWSHERDNDMEGLLRLFQESTGVLRQEAAIWLADSDEPLISKDLSAIVEELVRTMEDEMLSPEFRGDAIEAAGWMSEQPVIHEALLDLLEPDAWFSGIPDACRPSHSLSVVLDALDVEPGIEGDLLALKDRLDLLEEEHRRAVAWKLDRILAKVHRMSVN